MRAEVLCLPRTARVSPSGGVTADPAIATRSGWATGPMFTPLALRAPLPSAYYLVCAEGAVGRPAVKAFREWLLSEAAKETETA